MNARTFTSRSLLIATAAVSLALITGSSARAQSGDNAANKNPEPKIVESRPATNGAPTLLAEEKSEPVAAKAAQLESVATKPVPLPTPTPTPAQCKRTISADVVAIPQPIMMNRLGAAIPGGMIFALRRDTVNQKGTQLRADKRPRPIVLRANVGDCLTINFENSIPTVNFKTTGDSTSEVSLHVQGMEWLSGPTDDGSFVGSNNSSLASSSVQANMPPVTQTYTLFAKEEGTFLLYTTGDTSTAGNQLINGLFGALNVQPTGAEWYRSQVTQADLKLISKGTTPDGHPILDYGAVYPVGAKYPDGSLIPANTPVLSMLDKAGNIVHTDLTAIITGPNAGRFPGTTGVNNPEPNCGASNAVPPPGIDPLFCQNPAAPDRKQPYREITVIYHGALGAVASQAFPILSNAQQGASQQQKDLAAMTQAGQDAFAIDYGTGGIGAEIYANRIGVGPMGNCVDCKFEEFFLSSWSVGDPAMLVDRPANTNTKPPFATPPQPPLPPPPPLCSTTELEGTSSTAPTPTCVNSRQPTSAQLTGTVTFTNASPTVTGAGTHFLTEVKAGDELALVSSSNIIRGTVKTITNDTQLVLQASAGATANGSYLIAEPYTLSDLIKATRAYYPDDPSNVFHSYINDHVKFRILHGGRDVTHVHHQHAHQWLQSPNSDESSYLDSQMISPGASYTLEMVYNGSGNRNKVVGDSIFHCHFYPHFAAGMWALWRTHDVFEFGSELKDGIPIKGTRALPDGEITAGTPTPAVVPLPTLPMAPIPSAVFIDNGQVVYGTPGSPDPTGQNVKVNPGFPFFIPGVAGARAPHPPLDFAPDGMGGFLDGGLPRHVVTGGSIAYESHDLKDWSKDLATMNAIKLPEDGTSVEKVAMKFFGQRCYATFFPNGSPGSCPSSNSTPPQSTLLTPPTGFVVNGLPLGPQPGAPFADPAVDDNGKAVGNKRIYKAAALQADVQFNKKQWHFPQQRMLALWKDVQPTIDFTNGKPGRQPEPLFFRGNSGDVIEYWHTNLVPNYYLVDDFQVRTPTDILGQHIHLVKFDVTSSDGAGNGFNYEDGTFAPAEVQEMIRAINHSPTNGFVNFPNVPLMDPGSPAYKAAHAPPKDIFDCVANPTSERCQPCPDNLTPTNRPVCNSWLGAQTTIQRWYLDPLVDDNNNDRTMRTVFTHDHFGPSTHQQAGLYAGLLIEPAKSQWLPNDGVGPNFGTRSDGGPTSWQAIIATSNPSLSYREFALEFQDLQLAYQWATACITNPPTPRRSSPSPDPKIGWTDPAYAINPPAGMCVPNTPLQAKPSLITTGVAATPAGTQSVNYRNDPVAWRIGPANDMSSIYDNALKQASNAQPNGDPGTPLLRAYQNDNVQIRTLVGAHVFAHQFDLAGPVWFSEPSWQNSGYRSAQPMGLSEHFEMLFRVPSSSAPNIVRKCPDGMSQKNCVDYFYSPSMDEFGISNGMWGLFRSYDPTVKATKLAPLPNNTIGPNQNVTYATCPGNAPTRSFKISAVTAQKALPGGKIVFNSRGQTLFNDLGVLYVRSEDLDVNGKLKAGVPIEPLILRANAGDCINVTLTNALDPGSNVFNPQFSLPAPFGGLAQPSLKKMSRFVGLHPQLLGYDAATSTGMNIGWNRQNRPNQLAAPPGTAGQPSTVNYQWYAGTITRPPGGGALVYTPVEFGALNLFPSDQLYQNFNGLFGQMIIEPPGTTWQCGEDSDLQSCDPSPTPPISRASATVFLGNTKKFREFSLMISDDLRIVGLDPPGAVNYRTEPQSLRYPGYQNLTGSATFTSGSTSVTGAGTVFQTELVNGDKLVLQSSPSTVRGQVQSITNNTQLTLGANATANASGLFAKQITVTDFSCMTSNQLWNAPVMPVAQIGDPQTPIFTAAVGDQARFRMTHPFGTGTSQVFTVHGHVWQRNPYFNNSTQMGTNSLSQWIGSRDNHGSTDHFDIIIDKAGGEGGKAGDYLYTVFVPNQARNGAWGLFRVGSSNPQAPANAMCTPAGMAPAQPLFGPLPKEDVNRFLRQPVNKNPKP